MTGMEHAIEQAATAEAERRHAAAERSLNKSKYGEGSDYHANDGSRDGFIAGAEWAVEHLRAQGLLAPAPLREDGVGWYEVIHPSRATTHIAYVHEDGSIYFPEGTQVLDTHEVAFAAATGRAHRLVRADAVDRAEGDGSTDQ